MRAAKSRLTDMEINEVSTVDAAANQRRWIITKGLQMKTKIAKMELALPEAAKQGLMDAVAQGLDQLTAIATAVGDAKVDEAAAVPEALCMAMKEVADALAGAAQQYMGAPAEAPEGEEGAPPPPPPEGTPPPPPPGAEKSKDGGEDEEAKKALPSAQKDPPFKTPLSEGDNLKTLLHKAVAAAHVELGEVEKAGRKIASARFEKLSELHVTLGKLLNDLAYDTAAEGKAAKGVDSVEVSGLKKALEDAKAAQQKLEGKMAELGGGSRRLSALRPSRATPARSKTRSWPPPRSATTRSTGLRT
jgi:hypothetical protein